MTSPKFFIHGITLTIACMVCAAVSYSAPHKIRTGIAFGYSFVNEITPGLSFLISPTAGLIYPVTDKKNAVNTEIGIVTSFHHHFSSPYIESLSFGFGIRIFYNQFQLFRPYFTHEVKTQLTWIESRPGNGKTYLILLGFGVDIPVFSDDLEKESSSIYIDVNYLFYDLGFFEVPSTGFKAILVSAGLSLLL